MSKKKIPDGTPSKRELKKSGTTDWLNDAVREQEKKNRELTEMLGGDSDKVRRRQDELAGLLDVSHMPVVDEKPAAPDLFAQEREAGRAAKAGLADLFGDEQRRQQEEKDALLGMFGFESKPAQGKKKKR